MLFGSQEPLPVQIYEQTASFGSYGIFPGHEKNLTQFNKLRQQVQQHLIRSRKFFPSKNRFVFSFILTLLVLMEQRSGLLSLASLMERLDDKLYNAVKIYPKFEYYKQVHLTPRFIKANQPQTIKVRHLVQACQTNWSSLKGALVRI